MYLHTRKHSLSTLPLWHLHVQTFLKLFEPRTYCCLFESLYRDAEVKIHKYNANVPYSKHKRTFCKCALSFIASSRLMQDLLNCCAVASRAACDHLKSPTNIQNYSIKIQSQAPNFKSIQRIFRAWLWIFSQREFLFACAHICVHTHTSRNYGGKNKILQRQRRAKIRNPFMIVPVLRAICGGVRSFPLASCSQTPRHRTSMGYY